MFARAHQSDNGAADEVESMTYFQKCMKAILNMYQAKIYGSDRDLLGIVFFGTKTNNTSEDFAHIHTLQVGFVNFFIRIFHLLKLD